eukprot:CAMPEP_0194421122 /NCGR_PEP_ID=MMETSP0176-20130528/20357_1 /TAXON_ID=216777 /ORGANISM="Proboscia alata, Strain PI-D3" /LENGTH=407 /DNA_ID=CAMNT_0039229067 /DNA_START=225 /DNA_END=1448 /DNA_ORIENTATION=-
MKLSAFFSDICFAMVIFTSVSSVNANSLKAPISHQSPQLNESRDLQLLQNCFIDFLNCTTPAEEDSLPFTLDLECFFLMEPGNGVYMSVLYGPGADGACSLVDQGEIPDFITIDPDQGVAIDGEFSNPISIDRAKLAEAMGANPEAYQFSFCIENSILVKDFDGNDVMLAPHLTKVNVEVELDGKFELPANIILTTEVPVAEYAVTEVYTVSSYLCEEDPPHNPLPENTEFIPSDILRVCVITDQGDTIIQKLEDYKLVQYNEDGTINESFHYVKPDGVSGIAMYDCTKEKPDSDISGSMCLVEAKITKQFFYQPELGIKIEGDTDLRINPEVVQDQSRGRDLQWKDHGLQRKAILNNQETISVDGRTDLRISLSPNVDLFRSSSHFSQMSTLLISGLFAIIIGFCI